MSDVIVNDVSVQQFLEASEDDVAAGMTKQVLHEAARQDSAKLSSWVQAMKLEAVQQPLGARVVGFLQDDAVGIFAGAWNLCKELKDCAQETREHPGQASVTLTQHEFSYAMDPSVEVLADKVRFGKFDFEVRVSCLVTALVLVLEKGCVTAVTAGTCDGKASIALAGQEIWQRELVHVNLPGRLSLKRPVPL
jgi:hypothetical protein